LIVKCKKKHIIYVRKSYMIIPQERREKEWDLPFLD